MSDSTRKPTVGSGHPTNIETDHDYDGIREFDNPLPRWWLVTFFGAIVFAMIYWFLYQNSSLLPSQAETYAAEWAETELAIAAAQVNPEEIEAFGNDPEALARGKELYDVNCKACHMDKGQGLVGPNLTDNAWLYGGSTAAIYTSVAMGKPANGMPAWKPTLGATKVGEITAFLLTLKNTNIEGKAPQGEPEAAE